MAETREDEMSTENTNTNETANVEQGAQQQNTPAPRSDAEAAQQALEAEQQQHQQQQAATEESDKGNKNKSRTTVYIDRLKNENSDLRKQLRELSQGRNTQTTQRQAPGAQQGTEAEPTLEDCNFDQDELQRRRTNWAVRQALKEQATAQEESRTKEKHEEIVYSFIERRDAFAEEHPDFYEAVATIPYDLPPEVQLAIMAHEKGPEISYFIANDDDEAFALASINPALADAAVKRIAARMGAAPAANQAANAPAQQAANAAAKPISNAPAPAPTVGGRSPVETPQEKMTDDQWYDREREKKAKR